MMTALQKLWPFGHPDTTSTPAMRSLVSELHYELVPMASIEQAISDLPPHSNVSVTCSPVKGIAATLEYSERLLDVGHVPVPHLSARLVEDRDQTGKLACWLREHSIDEVFVIAGDAAEPVGPYEGAVPFIRDLIDADPGVRRIGVTGYPDGHAMLDPTVMSEQLHAKQELLSSAGVGGWVSTQMCFDADRIRAWLASERSAGLALPVRLGIPGVVDRTRLMTMGARLGIGASLRFLGKNRSTVMRLVAPGGYDPTDLVRGLAPDADRLGIEALHSFTFNAVAETRAWHDAVMVSGSSR